ncbi:MAG: hypothetical protein JNK02_09090 [Planctomycetes bacterium]|nr:hypothetical protein [Planctomycetota bacterium]
MHDTARQPLAGRWPLGMARLPEARHGHRAEFLDDGRLLLFGGFDDADRSGERGGRASWLFDPERTAWARTGDLPIPMQFHGSCVRDGVVYALGGGLARYAPARGKWELVVAGEALPRSHFAAASFGRWIVAAGGFQNALVDPHTGVVEPLPDYPGRTPQDHFALVATLDGALHVAGGYGGESFDLQTHHWAFDGASWSPRAPLPRPFAAKFAAWAAEPLSARLYVFDALGGLVYDARQDAWSELPAPPWSGYLVMPATAVRDGYFYVLGGETPDGSKNGVSIFDLRAAAWVTGPVR